MVSQSVIITHPTVFVGTGCKSYDGARARYFTVQVYPYGKDKSVLNSQSRKLVLNVYGNIRLENPDISVVKAINKVSRFQT